VLVSFQEKTSEPACSDTIIDSCNTNARTTRRKILPLQGIFTRLVVRAFVKPSTSSGISGLGSMFQSLIGAPLCPRHFLGQGCK
jgi:hypothetical protein